MGTSRSEGGGGYTVHMRLIEIVKYDKPEPMESTHQLPAPLPTHCSAYISLSVDKKNFDNQEFL